MTWVRETMGSQTTTTRTFTKLRVLNPMDEGFHRRSEGLIGLLSGEKEDSPMIILSLERITDALQWEEKTLKLTTKMP